MGLLEKGEELGNERIIPIFEDADDIRSHFNMLEPEKFYFDDRLDIGLLNFIKERPDITVQTWRNMIIGQQYGKMFFMILI